MRKTHTKIGVPVSTKRAVEYLARECGRSQSATILFAARALAEKEKLDLPGEELSGQKIGHALRRTVSRVRAASR